MKHLSTLAKALVAGAIAAATMSAASAAPIIGTANLTGLNFVLVSNGVLGGNVDWNNYDPITNTFINVNQTLPNVVRTYGAFDTVAISNTGSFQTGLPFLSSGKVQDLAENAADANYFPVNVASNVPFFLQFNAQPTWLFIGNLLAQGSFPGAPYLLTELLGATSATVTVTGTACVNTNANSTCDAGEEKSNFTAVFSAQYPKTIAALQQQLATTGRLDNNSYSATLAATAIPEPASIALFGLALAGLGIVRRRKAV